MSVRITLIVVDQDDSRRTSELRVERDTRSLAIAAMVTLLSTVDRLPVDHSVRPVDTPDTSFHDQHTPGLTCRYCLTPLRAVGPTWVDKQDWTTCGAIADNRVHEPIDIDRTGPGPGPCAFCSAQLLRALDGLYDAPGAGDGVAHQVCPGRVNGRHQPYDRLPIGNCSTCGKALRSVGSPGNVVGVDGSLHCPGDEAPGMERRLHQVNPSS